MGRWADGQMGRRWKQRGAVGGGLPAAPCRVPGCGTHTSEIIVRVEADDLVTPTHSSSPGACGSGRLLSEPQPLGGCK